MASRIQRSWSEYADAHKTRLLQTNKDSLLLDSSASEELQLVHSDAIVRDEFQANVFQHGPQRQGAPQDIVKRCLAAGDAVFSNLRTTQPHRNARYTDTRGTERLLLVFVKRDRQLCLQRVNRFPSCTPARVCPTRAGGETTCQLHSACTKISSDNMIKVSI